MGDLCMTRGNSFEPRSSYTVREGVELCAREHQASNSQEAVVLVRWWAAGHQESSRRRCRGLGAYAARERARAAALSERRAVAPGGVSDAARAGPRVTNLERARAAVKVAGRQRGVMLVCPPDQGELAREVELVQLARVRGQEQRD